MQPSLTSAARLHLQCGPAVATAALAAPATPTGIHRNQSPAQVLCEALAPVNTAADAPERKAVRRLLDSADARAPMFDAAQRAHLDAWRLRVIMPLHLAGDDAFVYNKAARNVRELIEGLPEVGPEEGAALLRIQVRRDCATA